MYVRRKDYFSVGIEGHVKIFEYNTTEDYISKSNGIQLLDKHNAVDLENASILIARGITHRPNGNISYMCFGNGGATIDPLGNVILNPPNITGAANLYNQTYFENVDDTEGAPAGNFMAVQHVTGSLISVADIYCVIGINEPFTQLPSDDIGGVSLNTEQFSFNEIGLKTADNLLITHITFAPILKSAMRLIEVVYSLTITVQ